MIRLNPSELIKREVPGSKSISNRFLILAALSEKIVSIKNLSSAQDTQDLLQCLKMLGLEIEENTEGVSILSSFPKDEAKDLSPLILYPGEGGTTLRFLMALLSLGSRRYHLHLDSVWRQRPIDDYIQLLHDLGVKISKKGNIIFLQGPLKKEKMNQIDSFPHNTSQVHSALRLISSYADISIPRALVSVGYDELTEDCLEKMSNNLLEVEPDLSSLATLATFQFIQTKKVLNWPTESKQPDQKYFQFLANWKSEPFEYDLSNTIDMIGNLAILSALTPGSHRIKNTQLLKFKESNRLEEIQKLLSLVERKSYLQGDDLIIEGIETPIPYFFYQAPKDHRMAMTAAMLMMIGSGGELSGEKAIKKSFPQFLSCFKARSKA
jgi:3-phosphoshikimate 1-carboxyvinyltransferase